MKSWHRLVATTSQGLSLSVRLKEACGVSPCALALAPLVALAPLRWRRNDALSGETAQLGLRVHFHEFVNVVLAAVAGLGSVTTPSSSSGPPESSPRTGSQADC